MIKNVESRYLGKNLNNNIFLDVKFYWARDYFPNFVEEDRRVMVSYDGYIYFSALEKIDRGNYSCSVQSSVSNQVRKQILSNNLDPLHQGTFLQYTKFLCFL